MCTLSRRRKLVYFDQTQNERGRLDSTYSDLGHLLKDNDYDVEPYTEFMILPKNLEHCSVFVLGCPNSSKVRQAEIDALKKFVKKGGGLFLLSLSGGDRGLMNNMTDISVAFGIKFENTAVKDERTNAGLPTMPIIKDLEQHATTSGVSDILFPSGCSLKVSNRAAGIAKTADTADPPSQPVIAVAEFGQGKVICAGSYELFRRGGGLKHQGNVTFALNAFKWLSGGAVEPVEEVNDSDGTPDDEPKLKKPSEVATPAAKEMEQTLRRLVNAVFDLQKDIGKLTKQITSVEENIDQFRDQFQSFAEKTQEQLGLMLPARQFKTEEENIAAELESDIRSLEAELRSVEQLQEHIEQRHSSGAMPREAYDEQSKKLQDRVDSISKKLEKKREELKALVDE